MTAQDYQKSHPCEGGTYLRNSVWYLSMNLKNNYLLKNCWSGPIKNARILIFTLLYFLKKNKEKHLEISYFTPVYQKSWWYDLQFLRYRVCETEIGYYKWFFVLLHHLKNLENHNFEKMKKIASDIIILHMCTKNHNHMMYASWKMECNRHKFLSFWTIFCRFTTQLTPKFKIWKKCTERPGDIIFLHMCKWRSCDVWFLRYKAQKTEFLVILGHFLPSDPPNNLNNQNFEKF